MVEVCFYDKVEDSQLKFAVIIAKTYGKWVFCKHKDRQTFEFPGGHREKKETILETAMRELKEETSAIDFDIKPIKIYSVKEMEKENSIPAVETFGMLYYAEIKTFEKELHYEIETLKITDEITNEIDDNWTYPFIQPHLLKEARRCGFI